MKAHIHLDFTPTAAESYHLERLAEQFAETGLETRLRRSQSPAGVKDGGVVLAIAVSGLAISAIGVFISAISLWRSDQPTFQVAIRRGEITETIGNLTQEEAKTLIARLSSGDKEEDIEVTISK